jgi:hypothetical protein
MNQTDNSSELESSDFSVIRFFALFKKAIGGINAYPLTLKNLVIQQDAYKRLGAAGYDYADDDDELDVPFATIACTDKRHDTDLRFHIGFGHIGFLLDIEGVGASPFYYDDCFDNEVDAVAQITTVLTMLANGQIAVLLTSRFGNVCAGEVLFYESHDSSPLVVGVRGSYPLLWRVSDESGYVALPLLRNQYIDSLAKDHRRLFLFDYDKQGKIVQVGRSFPKKVLTPLTKKMHKFYADQMVIQKNGDSARLTDTTYLYRSWEYWLITVTIIGVFVAGLLFGHVPSLVIAACIFVIGNASTYIFLPRLLAKKEELVQVNPKHPWIKADALFHHHKWINTEKIKVPSTVLIRIVSILYVPQMIVVVAASACMVWSGFMFYETLLQDSMQFGTPRLAAVFLCTVAALNMLALVLLAVKR